MVKLNKGQCVTDRRMTNFYTVRTIINNDQLTISTRMEIIRDKIMDSPHFSIAYYLCMHNTLDHLSSLTVNAYIIL